LDFLRDQVRDLSPAEMVAQPNGMTYTCELLGGVTGLPPWLPEGWAGRFATGTVPVADAGEYEPKDDALAVLRDAQSRITHAVERLDHGRLDDAFLDQSYRHVFPTIRHALTQVLVGHTAYHVGQLSVWRKAMGLPGVGRVFE
jgi:hypothetical protein